MPSKPASAANASSSMNSWFDFLTYAYDLIYRRYPIDAGRHALLGYSDGASYALAVGLSNPHLFRAVMGWAASKRNHCSQRPGGQHGGDARGEHAGVIAAPRRICRARASGAAAGGVLRSATMHVAKLSASLAFAAVAALACSSTKLVSTFEDPGFSGGPFRKLMVVGLGASEGGRASFENAVADKLAAQGVLGVASGNVLVAAADLNRDAVRGWVEKDGYDAVLVTRLVDTKNETTYRPPTYGDFYGYWGYYGSYVSSPGYVLETTTLLIESTLFDAATGKVVYSAESKSFQPSSRDQVVHELVPLLVGDLTKRRLLASR